MAFAPAARNCEIVHPLAASACWRPVISSRWPLLAALVLLCLIPRAVAAWKIDTLCKDGVFYVQLASGYEQGDLEAGLGRLRLNTYPLILAGLHQCGLSWELAARLWGVAVSSLVVLPLFGWVRRQFDDRAAICACLLYAIHPKLIEWSPEAVRDPTFWLFWTCSLYAAWRAVTEVRLVWFLAAGAAITLALNTRFEGWFLYLPLGWWTAWRYCALTSGKGRLVLGATLALAVCPLTLVAANVTFLSRLPRWEYGHFGRLEYVTLWCQSTVKELSWDRSAPQATGVPTAVIARSPAQPTPQQEVARSPAQSNIARNTRMSAGKTAIVFLNTMRRGIGGIFGLCWIIGFLSHPRLWFRRDHLAMFLTAACIAGGIWVHLWYAQATSSRYFLSIVILASGCSAWGCLQAHDWLRQTATRVGLSPSRQRFAQAFCLLAIGALGVGEGLYTQYPGRERDAAVGKWLKNRLGAERRLATSGPMELVDHYAEAAARSLPCEAAPALEQLAEWRPGAVVLSRRALAPDELDRLVAGARDLGFSPVASAQMPAGYDWKDLVVLECQSANGGITEAARPDLARRER